MASLVGVLASGVASAAGGSVEFYTHGTAVLSTQVYSEADGESAVTEHTLGSDGEIIRYVTEPVDVVVMNEDGATVREFTHMDDARVIRVESLGFTGPNDSGQTVAAGRIVMQTVLTKLYESLLATDALVNVSGTPQTLAAALGASGAVFYHVKNTYGATGDGSTDDTGAIQAAINAAVDAGGGLVYFPPGTYNITSGLSVAGSSAITLLGAGADETIIEQQTDAVDAWLEMAGDGTQVIGLNFQSAGAAYTGTMVEVQGDGCIFIGCKFGSFAGGQIDVEPGTSALAARVIATFNGCRFELSHVSGQFIETCTELLNSSHSVLSFNGCSFDLMAVPSTTAFGQTRAFFNACSFAFNSTSGGATMFAAVAFESAILNGGMISSLNTSGTNVFAAGDLNISNTMIRVSLGGTLSLSSTKLYDSGCRIDSVAGTVNMGAGAFAGDGAFSVTRDRRRLNTTINGTSETLSREYGVHNLTHSSGASLALTATNGAPGSFLTIIYANNTGGAITPTGNCVDAATSIGNGQTAVYVSVADTSGVFRHFGDAVRVF